MSGGVNISQYLGRLGVPSDEIRRTSKNVIRKVRRRETGNFLVSNL